MAEAFEEGLNIHAGAVSLGEERSFRAQNDHQSEGLDEK